jgi:hypothetical protein
MLMATGTGWPARRLRTIDPKEQQWQQRATEQHSAKSLHQVTPQNHDEAEGKYGKYSDIDREFAEPER